MNDRIKAATDVMYTFLDEILSKGFSLISFAVAAYLFDKDFLGVWGIAAMAAVVVSYFNIMPEFLFFRESNNLDRDKIDAYMQFGFFKLFGLFLLGATISVVYSSFHLPLFMPTMLVLCLQYLATSFADSIRLYFLLEFRNKESLHLNVIYNSAATAVLLSSFLFPTQNYYMAAIAAIALGRIAFWFGAYRAKFRFRFRNSWQYSWQIVWHSIRTFSFYVHLIGLMLSFVYDFDLIILHHFDIPLHLIGEYAIVVKMTFIGTLLPTIMVKYYSARVRTMTGDVSFRQIPWVLAVFTFVAVVQWLAAVVFGKWAMTHLFNSSNLEFTYPIMLIILGGSAILNALRVFTAFAVSKMSIRHYFLGVVLPVSVFSLVAYYGLSAYYGPMGTAWGNVIAYGSLGLGSVVFVVLGKRLGLMQE